jgi:anti-anti-sigma factor
VLNDSNGSPSDPPSTRFAIRGATDVDPRFAVVTVSGELDLGTAGLLWPHLEVALVSTPAEVVVLDATDLDFIDSSGLRVLLRAARLAQSTESAAAFRVVAPHPVVQRVLDLSGARQALDLRQSVAEALA